MLPLRLVPVLFLSLSLLSCTAHSKSSLQYEKTASTKQEETLPTDPAVITGRFDNGLTYYIRKNEFPEKRAELRLIVKAGSVLEDNDQKGLAHFVEHMAFNGTSHFKKHEIVDYLESIGMRFGPDVNAYTTPDETVYLLQIPTDDAKVVSTSFQILEDWAHLVSFDDDEIDRERGVVMEEWRLKRGADARIRDKQLPLLLKGSRYAVRPTIGDTKILASFEHDTLRRFYKKWYRPELMAVVAVGDFDTDAVKKIIQERFSQLPSSEEAPARKHFQVPPNKGTIYSIVNDPEVSGTTVGVYYKSRKGHPNDSSGYRHQIARGLYVSMLNERLADLSRKEDPPFLSAGSRNFQPVESRRFFALSAAVKPGGSEQGLKALLTEIKRIQQYGFTPDELEQHKKALLRSIEQAFRERGKMSSSDLVSECVDNFLHDDPMLSIESEYELHTKIVPEITLDEVNRIASEWEPEDNRVVLVSGSEAEGVKLPNKQQLSRVVREVEHTTVASYVYCKACGPLLKSLPTPSHIASENSIPEIGVTEWKLANGVRVILKPTDFKNDEIRFTSFSPGGTSLVPASDIVAAETAPAIVSESGVGDFDRAQLQRLLADKAVNVSPYIDSLTEGLSGGSSPKDLETLFQLIYLFFTSPREDNSAFTHYKARLESMCENRTSSPEAVFSDTLLATLTQDNPRYKPWTRDMVSKMDLAKSLAIYRNRFADASGFTFLFVGNFDLETIKPMITTYLGGLPSLARNETWRNVTYQCPSGVVEKSVIKGTEPKSLNSVVFSTPFEWTRENRYVAIALADLLRTRLRERLRVDLSGTYGVSVQSSLTHFPKERCEMNISFGCDPRRVDELTSELFKELKRLKTNGTTLDYLNRVKEMHLREFETNLRDNGFWLSVLESRYFNGEDPRNILTFKKMITKVSPEDIKRAAQNYLKNDNYIRVVLYPEK